MKPVNPKGNQSWIFIGRNDAEVEPPILWPPDAESQLIGKDLMLRRIEGRRRRGWQRTRWLEGIVDSMDMSLSKLQEMVKDMEGWCAIVHGVTKSQIRLSNWTHTHTWHQDDNREGKSRTQFLFISSILRRTCIFKLPSASRSFWLSYSFMSYYTQVSLALAFPSSILTILSLSNKILTQQRTW